MNEVAVRQENAVAISIETEELIKAGVAENTLKAYRRALQDLEAWLAVEEKRVSDRPERGTGIMA